MHDAVAEVRGSFPCLHRVMADFFGICSCRCDSLCCAKKKGSGKYTKIILVPVDRVDQDASKMSPVDPYLKDVRKETPRRQSHKRLGPSTRCRAPHEVRFHLLGFASFGSLVLSTFLQLSMTPFWRGRCLEFIRAVFSTLDS